MRSIAFMLIIGTSAACGNQPAVTKNEAALANSSAGQAALAAPAAPPQSGVAAVSSFWASQKLIRTAELNIQVRDASTAVRMADSIARSQQALVADSRSSQDGDGKRTTEMVIRVPSQQFSALLQALRPLGSVQVESVATQDVTKEYADLETRLAVKEQTVARLRDLLQGRTAKLSDILEVERELDRAVAEVEQLKGERRYFDQQIALSTVKLTLFERVPSQVSQITKPVGDALQSAMNVLGTSVGMIIYLAVALLPWVVVTLALVWWVPPLRRRFWPKRSGGEPPVV